MLPSKDDWSKLERIQHDGDDMDLIMSGSSMLCESTRRASDPGICTETQKELAQLGEMNKTAPCPSAKLDETESTTATFDYQHFDPPSSDEEEQEIERNLRAAQRRRFMSLMERSRESQEILQQWDLARGLPKSHSLTMVKSNESRLQLVAMLRPKKPARKRSRSN